MNKVSVSVLILVQIFNINAGSNDLHAGKHLDKSLLEKMAPTLPYINSRHDILKLLPIAGMVAEIGVGDGDFAHSIKMHSKPSKLYLIDCWEQQPKSVYPDDFNVSTELQLERYAAVKKAFIDDKFIDILRMYSSDAVKLFPDNHFDWVYIDSNHTYAAVKADLEMWLPKVKDGGFICGHDYVLPSEVGGICFGVVPAVNEFIKNNSLELVYLTTEKFATYVIRVKK